MAYVRPTKCRLSGSYDYASILWHQLEEQFLAEASGFP